ncbi:MAG: helix-turn-helix transcriptional regulator [Thalassovita sp.]|nr:helix-turn-helix transcriptional regulator [Thalassovita sp.]
MKQTQQSSTGSRSELIRAKSFGTALSRQVLGRTDSLSGQSWVTVLLEEGEIQIRTPEHEWELRAPAVAWLPWHEGCRLSLSPGASGVFVNIAAPLLFGAIGYKAEANDLKAFSARQISLDLSQRQEISAALISCFHSIAQEHAQQAGGARTLIEAYLRIVLVRLWRALDHASRVEEPKSPRIEIYTRFHALVESHFRSRWGVMDYAQELGVSRDRLGDICRHASGRSPKQVIDQRSEIEARLLLEHSTNSVEQIAGLLGFPSPGHFSRFFQRMTGVAPSRFRAEQLWVRPEREDRSTTALYEWP